MESVNEQSSFTQQVWAASSTNIGGLAAPDGRSMTASVKRKSKAANYEKMGGALIE